MGAAEIHVSKQGLTGATGTVKQPVASVQEALDRAQPGDVVKVHPGIYNERVSFKTGGTYGKPVTLLGEPGAILDGSDPITLHWEPSPDIAPGVYRAKGIKIPVFLITAEGKIVTILREDRVAAGDAQHGSEWEWPTIFKEGIGPSKWSGVKALALYFKDKQELIIRFEGDKDPRSMKITVGPVDPVVKIEGVNRCVVKGLTLHNSGAGVSIGESLGSVVENCVIGPVDYGITLNRRADRATLQFNEIFIDPYAGADPRAPGSWDNWTAHKRGGYYDRYGIYIHSSSGGHEIHDNYIHDNWDGIHEEGGKGLNVGLRIHHNRISKVIDDGVDTSGANEDCQWHDNIIERCIAGFRFKHPTVGPMYVYRNIFFENKEDFRNYGEWVLEPAMIYAYQNTCTAPPAIQSNKVYGIGTPNYHYFNNLFICGRWFGRTGNPLNPNWKGDYNVYVRQGESPGWEIDKALAVELGMEQHSTWVESAAAFPDWKKKDVTLGKDSPALGKGVDLSSYFGRPLPGCEPGYFKGKAPDAGALAEGQPVPVIPRRAADVKTPVSGSWPGPEAEAEFAARKETEIKVAEDYERALQAIYNANNAKVREASRAKAKEQEKAEPSPPQ